MKSSSYENVFFFCVFSDRKEFEEEGLALPNNSTNAQPKFTKDKKRKTTYLSDNHTPPIKQGSFLFSFLFHFILLLKARGRFKTIRWSVTLYSGVSYLKTGTDICIVIKHSAMD